ncbi:hypothetical protein CsatA_000062 [Cannabis sativa]
MENNNSNKNSRYVLIDSSPVHNQVKKIKEESEKIVDWLPGKAERRSVVVREIISRQQQISRSPLGGPVSCSSTPISVGP